MRTAISLQRSVHRPRPTVIQYGTRSFGQCKRRLRASLWLSSNANATNATAIGTNASASGINATAMGLDANASGRASLSLGRSASSSGDVSTALGTWSNAAAENS